MSSRNPKSIDREKIEEELVLIDQDELDDYLQNLDSNTMSADDNAWLVQHLRETAEEYLEQARQLSIALSIRREAKSR